MERIRPASVRSERLAELTAAGLLLREVDPGPPVGVRYRLAPRGVALAPVLQDLTAWARANLDDTACRAVVAAEQVPE